MGFVMMKLTLPNVIMMGGTVVVVYSQNIVMIVLALVQLVVKLQTHLLEIAYVMMKQIISNAIMMVETVVDTASTQSIVLNAHASTKRHA